MDLTSLELVLAAIALILGLLYYLLSSNLDYWTRRGVKGPKPSLFFGSLGDIVLGKRHISSVFQSFYEEYKSEPYIGIFQQTSPALVLIDRDIIMTVLIKDFHAFTERGIALDKDVDPFSQNLVALPAEPWKQLRMKLSPVFTSGKLKDMFGLINDCGEHLHQYIDELLTRTSIDGDGTIDARDLASKYTSDAIGVCAFGLNLNAIGDADSEFRRIGRKTLEPSLRTTLSLVLRPYPRIMRLLKSLLINDQIIDFFTKITMDTIDYRVKNGVERNDFVEVLIEMKKNPKKLEHLDVTDTFLAAQSVIFFTAGFETSSTAISHALLELALNPDIQDKLRAEMQKVLRNNSEGQITYDDLKNMPYLDKVVKETLRKYPPVTMLLRIPTVDYTFEETKLSIPKGTRVFTPVYAIHHDNSIYPDPEKFDPERFEPEVESQRHPMSYLPFGNGPRNCIGLRFANLQTKIGIIKIVKNYNITISEEMRNVPYTIKPRCVVVEPVHPIRLKLTRLEDK